MSNRLFICFLLLVLAIAAPAADEKLPALKVGGQTFTNVTVTTVTATDIHFFHAHGIGNAKLKDLDPEMQAHFHFNATAADAAEQARAAGNAAYLKKIETPHPVTSAATENPPAANPATAGPDDIVVPKLYAKSFLHQRAPNFVVEKWLTPEPSLEGKFILIDFWATWCGPCKKAIPHLNGLYAKYKDRVVFVGISDEPEGAVRQLVDPHIDYSVAIDTARRMHDEIKVEGIPHAMLIDPHGYVRFEGMPGYLNEENFGKLLARYGK